MKVQSDTTLSVHNFHRYQMSRCHGMSYRQLGKTSINFSTIAFGMSKNKTAKKNSIFRTKKN